VKGKQAKEGGGPRRAVIKQQKRGGKSPQLKEGQNQKKRKRERGVIAKPKSGGKKERKKKWDAWSGKAEGKGKGVRGYLEYNAVKKKELVEGEPPLGRDKIET